MNRSHIPNHLPSLEEIAAMAAVIKAENLAAGRRNAMAGSNASTGRGKHPPRMPKIGKIRLSGARGFRSFE